MSLAQYQPETISVKLNKNTSVDLHGISMNDFSKLLRVHYQDLSALFDQYENSTGLQMTNVALGRYAMNLIRDCPALVAHMIAIAADEPDMVDMAAKLPLLAQLDCLKAIGKLTMEEVGNLKKLVTSLTSMAAQVRKDEQNQIQ